MTTDTGGTSHQGKVLLIGAGPGDPDLMTRKAVNALSWADVVVFDRLVSPEILEMVPNKTEMIDVGKAPGRHKLPQDQINALLVQLGGQGRRVARLKGGDPVIFGRGGEEASGLRRAGIAYEYIPGITSAQGMAASTGVPLTHRGLASGVRYVTGHRAKDAPLDLDWASLANDDTTLVVYMGAMNIAIIASKLIRHGMASSLPVMAVSAATTPNQTEVLSDLAHIAKDLGPKTDDAPILFVIGHVVSLCPAAARETGQKARQKAVAYG